MPEKIISQSYTEIFALCYVFAMCFVILFIKGADREDDD